MNEFEIFLLLLEILGTIAFAISGAYVAIKAKLDVFGVVFIGCITCVGGGITRDLIIGVTPPSCFSSPYLLPTAILTSIIVFIGAYIYRKKFETISIRIEQAVNVFDAIGLGVFSVMGTEVAFVNGLEGNWFLAIMLGMLTAVGGGALRDVLTSETPYIFKKHVYAVASLLGATLYYVLRLYTASIVIASISGILLVIIIRLLATHFRWSLPRAHLELDYEPINIKIFKKK